MTEQAFDERAITDYLLGTLPASEIDHYDELSLTNDDFAEVLKAVENDLVDAYVRGELSGSILSSFQSNYLASPRRRNKVIFAKTLLEIEKSRITPLAEEAVQKKSGRPGWFHLFTMPRPSLQLGFAAAAIVMLIAGAFLMVENIRLRAQIAQTRHEHAALQQREQELQQKLALKRSSDIETQKELERVRGKLQQLERELAAIAPKEAEQEPVLLAFNLSPQARGTSKIPQLMVPPGAGIIVFTLILEPNDFSVYQAVLENSEADSVLWRSGKLKADAGGQQVQLRISTKLLKPQNYILELSGIATDGSAEIVGSYRFRIKTN